MGKNHSGDAGAKQVDARVARRRQDAIGRRLRQMYDDVVNESVPDEFLSFLEQADERDPPSQKKSADGANGTEPVEAAPVGRAVKTEP
ncbi:MAG TPA: NepR family anti-sigma factor [Hyphomonadaceae bacterium]|nr:NepR family anti-sigma factor [Hyphomonadaceae bacterium]